MEDMDWDLVSFVIRSNYRFKVLKRLLEGNSTPSTISKEITIRTNHVSVILRELEEKNLVKCLYPNKKKGKIFEITDLGKKTFKHCSDIK